MKIWNWTISVGLFVTAVSVLLLKNDVHKERVEIAQRRRTDPPSRQYTEADLAPSIKLQQTCAAQAKEVFRSEGWEGKEKNSLANFTNHYNQKLHRCFIRVDDMRQERDGIWMNTEIADVFEHKSHGEYMWKSDKVEKYWDVAPFICHVTLPFGIRRHATHRRSLTR